MNNGTLYEELVRIGAEIDGNGDDLFAVKTEEAVRVLERRGETWSTFVAGGEKGTREWIEVSGGFASEKGGK